MELSKKMAKYCPECISINIGMPKTHWKARAGSPHYSCRDCGFEGLMPEATIGEIEKIRKEKTI